ncbi:YrhK family protein [Niallia nealsonii]|uniref:YrhK domain-containing protein n=1 Tax=Niallia nealsonii TaxID=115979 RepID=A0A2N0Z3E8_9BACI|nr:YrhK family protein [Niallia nealsonii]PKG24047.1 hypothetical protein CWS01_08220 [Niallia nealsonii]
MTGRKKYQKKDMVFRMGKWKIIVNKAGLFNNLISFFSAATYFIGSILFSQKEWRLYGSFAFIIGSVLLLFAASVRIVHHLKIKRAESSV